ncbi:MAG: protoporphyrinogen oxidase [Acidobacteriota bacterium]
MTTVVVGAGLSGLICARALHAAGADVRLLESTERSGGVVRTERSAGFLLEQGPNTVRPTPEILATVADLGLDGEALFSDPRAPRYMALDGRLVRLPASPAEAVRTPLLTAAGKLRLAVEPFILRRRGDSDETVEAFFTRRIGAEAASRLVAPFVSGIFAGDPRRLSAASTFPALVRGERERGSLAAWALRARSGARKPGGPPGPRGLLSFREGLETLPRALAASLGTRLETGVGVLEIAPGPAGGGWSVRHSRERLAADRVVLACPAREAAALVAGFAPEAAAALSGIPHPPLAVIHLAWTKADLKTRLAGFGHLAVPAPGRRILGAVWSSSLFPGRAPEGQQLLTAFAGGATDPEAAALSDADLTELAARELVPLLSATAPPRLLGVRRWARSIPQYETGHARRMDDLARAEARWPGLSFLGSYRGGVSVGDVVRGALAEAASRRLRL